MANTSGAIQRITKELRHIQEDTNLSLAVSCRDSDVRSVRALIIGPPDTPYEFGFFEFDIRFPREYPNKAPVVRAITTNSGRCRFNPNIYAEGKVCLSILGTWRGEKGEEWSSAQGLESVLLSIQSLMSSNPYENEPGFEDTKKESEMPKKYVAKIRHETLRVSVLGRMEALLHHGFDTGAGSLSPGSKRPFAAYEDAVEGGTESGEDSSDSDLSDDDSTTKVEEIQALWSAEAALAKQPSPAGSGTSKMSESDKAAMPANSHLAQPHAAPDNNSANIPAKNPPSKAKAPKFKKVKPSMAHEHNAESAYLSLEPPWDPFADIIKRRFLWYYDSYLAAIESASKEQPDGTPFTRMEFEYPPNSMEGNFHYKSIRARFENVRKRLDEERESWVRAGKLQVEKDTQLATQLFFTLDQLKYKFDSTATECGLRIELALEDKKNPFRWHITLFGNSDSNLDGGVFNLQLTIPPDYPESQPRVQVETPIFHHRVSSTGVLCYFPQKSDEIESHLQGIAAAFADEAPRYDPRAVVNPEAAALFWGGDDKRKVYNRKLRRSAQDSSEY